MDLEDLRAVTQTATEPQVLSAYRAGLFPMGIGRGGSGRMGWWAPRRRGVLLPGDLRVTKSLRKSMRHFDYSVNAAFGDVIRACADPSRSGTWITGEIIALYEALHDDGWAHSVEVWAEGRLVGGLYGVAIGSLFAGESMFHRERDASKAALAHLVGLFDEEAADASATAGTTSGADPERSAAAASETDAKRSIAATSAADSATALTSENTASWLIDTQWQTPHLESLGVSEISGLEYAARLVSALRGDHAQRILTG